MDEIFIINNLENNSESDSETSTTSEAEELKYYINNEKLENMIEPIDGMSIKLRDNEDEIIINDSFEIIMLRLHHLLLNEDGVMRLNKVKEIMNEELYEFLIENPGVAIDKEFYKSQAGINLREKWCLFLSKRSFIYSNVNYEIIPSMNNLKKFFEIFYKIELDNNENNLNNLYNRLSNLNLKIINLVNYELLNNEYCIKENQKILIDNIEFYEIEFINKFDKINNKSLLRQGNLRYI